MREGHTAATLPEAWVAAGQSAATYAATKENEALMAAPRTRLSRLRILAKAHPDRAELEAVWASDGVNTPETLALAESMLARIRGHHATYTAAAAKRPEDRTPEEQAVVTGRRNSGTRSIEGVGHGAPGPCVRSDHVLGVGWPALPTYGQGPYYHFVFVLKIH